MNKKQKHAHSDDIIILRYSTPLPYQRRAFEAYTGQLGTIGSHCKAQGIISCLHTRHVKHFEVDATLGHRAENSVLQLQRNKSLKQNQCNHLPTKLVLYHDTLN